MKPNTKREKALIKIKEIATNKNDNKAKEILQSIELYCQLIFELTLNEKHHE